MGDEKITILKGDKEIECDILFTFSSEDTLKSYVAYTDNIVVDGKKNIYISSFDPVVGMGQLEDVVDEKELEMVEDVLKQIENS